MYYRKSKEILKAIKRANKILINVHHHPDLDAVGSAGAMWEIISAMGKRATIVSCRPIDKVFSFLAHCEKIQPVDFARLSFSPYDLFIVLDSSSYDRVTGDKKIFLPKNLPLIVIDHHRTNEFVSLKGSRYRVSRSIGTPLPNSSGSLKSSKQISSNLLTLVDIKASATAEILYHIFADGKVKITKDMATALFSGIAGDTVFFKYPRNPPQIFAAATDLLKKGADVNKLVSGVYNQYDFQFIKLLGIFLERMSFDKKQGFVWSAVPHEIYKKFGHPAGVRELVADMFFQSVAGADFGIAMLEEEKGKLSVSFRSKGDFDVSSKAQKLGGGGHKNAAGATVYGDFNQTVKKILRHLT